MAAAVLGRCPPNGISVLISGAGVGGLMAALECWRKGCDVRILERSKCNVTTGDSFTIGPTAIRSFRNWPDMQLRNEEIAYNPLVAFYNHKGELLDGPKEVKEIMSKEASEASTSRICRHSRPKFHNMLYEQLAEVGIAVEYGKEVVEYFEHVVSGRAGVIVNDGARYDADLVIASDGVRGASWSLIAGEPVPARSCGDAIFRVAYPVELAMADDMVATHFKLTKSGRSVMELWIGIRDHGTAEESWGQKVNPEEVLKYTATVPDWPEVADRVIKTTPADQLIDWKLMWRDPQPQWTSPSGHVVKLGDAAHTFLPSAGNGANQAIEDAVSLAECIALAGDRQKIPEATRVHNLLRFERVSCLQAFGVVNHNRNATPAADKSAAKKNQVHIGKWMLEHDPEQYAIENYQSALAHLQTGAAFKNTNIPPGVVYTPWTIDGLLEAQAKGEPTVLDGDWE